MSTRISEVEGDLFTAPEGTILVHACNSLGMWGSGIAGIFARNYPAAYKVYSKHCKDSKNNAFNIHNHSGTGQPYAARPPLGTTLLIPPLAEDYSLRGGKRHWIACLFTSYGAGGSVMPPDVIMEHTVNALRDMVRQVLELRTNGEDVGQIYSCRFNSGLFHVDWKYSKALLVKECAGIPELGNVVVVRPKGEPE